MIAAAWVCLLSPLAGALTITVGGTRLPRRATGWVATASTSISFVAAVVAFVKLLSENPDQRHHLSTAWTWLGAGNLHFGLTILVDPLSIFMMLVVSGVGSLIVAYSIAYMHDDPEERRYFAYMALFVFSMLMLVQGGNLLLLLVGWGLVGLSSYLLIGFHHERPSAIAAAKQAFIMNAVGDATMALALFLLIQHTGSLGFDSLIDIGGSSDLVIDLVALGLLGGAVAKSAQIPLHTWLPDAMEGPTPVSALIHAATMVTAGVYLIARCHNVFELAPDVQDTAAILGAVTLVVAGLIALVQTDIKRVIAYSTMSQIGYMFVGVGLGAYGSGLFHLMTHAFFKALLFMAAGVVIHALAGEQDIRKMGGLGRELPWTMRLFVVGAPALAAIPPFAGFFSKDSILASAIEAGTLGWILWGVGVVGAFLTALYTFRLVFIVFGRDPDPYVREHLHRERWEGPAVMMWPVAVLAVLSVVGGFIQVPAAWDLVNQWIDPVAESAAEATGVTALASAVIALAAALLGVWVAASLYRRPSERPTRIRTRMPRTTRALEHKLYFDELYDGTFYEPSSETAVFLRDNVEESFLLASLGELGAATRRGSGRVAGLQTGAVRLYVLAVAVGLAALAVAFLIAS